MLVGGMVMAQHAPMPRGSSDAVSTTKPARTLNINTDNANATMPAGTSSTPMDHPGGSKQPVERADFGTLRLTLKQGTKGAPPLKAVPVTIDLLSRGQKLKTIEKTLDDGVTVELDKLALSPAFQPIITVARDGAVQQMVGPALHPMQSKVELEMSVYEITSDKINWTMGMRHVTMMPMQTPTGVVLKVEELVGVYNPTDRAWTGDVQPDGERMTYGVQLPKEASDVLFGKGMLEAGAKVKNNMIVRGTTMVPGASDLVYGYSLPVKDGKATLTLISPGDTGMLAVYVPGDFKVEKFSGVGEGKASGLHGASGRILYKAKDVKPGAVTVFELSGIKVQEARPRDMGPVMPLNLPKPEVKK